LHRDGVAVAAIGSTPHTGRTRTVVVRNTLVAGGVDADAVTHILARMLEAPLLARPEHRARTLIVILLGSDILVAR